MAAEVLIIEKGEGIATLTLNRPEALNALSRELRRAIAKAFREFETDKTIRVVILTGAGRAFCAGLDLKEMAGGAPEGEALSTEDNVMEAITSFSGPIIGAINGHAVTGGFELALACDILIASTEARFADTHARVGMLPGWGLSQKLPRLIGITRAKEMCFTGNYITAEQAEKWALVNRVVPPSELLPTCRALARDMASCDATLIANYKRLINDGFGMTFAEAMNYEDSVAKEWARKVTAKAVAARRKGVLERGRKQDHK